MPTLHLTVFWCLDADPYVFRTPAIFTACRSIAQNYGLSLETLPQNVRDPGFILEYSGDVIGPSDWQRGLQAMSMEQISGFGAWLIKHFRDLKAADRLRLAHQLNSRQAHIGQTKATTSKDGRTYESDWLPCVSSIQRRPTIVPIHCSTR